MQVLADGAVDAAEVERLVTLRRTLELGDAEVRALHAQAFAAALLTGVADQQVHEHERVFLAGVARGLRELGWCPGD